MNNRDISHHKIDFSTQGIELLYLCNEKIFDSDHNIDWLFLSGQVNGKT